MDVGIIYLMKSKTHTEQAKFGHRTKPSAKEVIDEVNREYESFTCYATYNLGIHDLNTIEFTVKQIRTIINIMAGNIEDAQPEYYNASPDKILSILKAISELRKTSKNLIEV